MEQTFMKDRLLELYTRHWKDYVQHVRKTTSCAFPFLIIPRRKYEQADKRVMICGQETQGWGNEYDRLDPDTITVSKISGIYNGFVNHGAYNSPYWNFNHKTEAGLPDVGFVYNNIVKAGKRHGAGCDDHINNLMLEHFPVFIEELKILKPDVILFHTGFNYDERIRKVLGPFKVTKAHDKLNIDILQFENTGIPVGVRTYHPGYIQRSGGYDEYSKAIITTLKNLL